MGEVKMSVTGKFKKGSEPCRWCKKLPKRKTVWQITFSGGNFTGSTRFCTDCIEKVLDNGVDEVATNAAIENGNVTQSVQK